MARRVLHILQSPSRTLLVFKVLSWYFHSNIGISVIWPKRGRKMKRYKTRKFSIGKSREETPGAHVFALTWILNLHSCVLPQDLRLSGQISDTILSPLSCFARHDFLFVSSFGDHDGVLTRRDLPMCTWSINKLVRWYCWADRACPRPGRSGQEHPSHD